MVDWRQPRPDWLLLLVVVVFPSNRDKRKKKKTERKRRRPTTHTGVGAGHVAQRSRNGGPGLTKMENVDYQCIRVLCAIMARRSTGLLRLSLSCVPNAAYGNTQGESSTPVHHQPHHRTSCDLAHSPSARSTRACPPCSCGRSDSGTRTLSTPPSRCTPVHVMKEGCDVDIMIWQKRTRCFSVWGIFLVFSFGDAVSWRKKKSTGRLSSRQF